MTKPFRIGRGPRPVSLPTTAEMRLLQILWHLGDATVEQVVAAHPATERPNYKTTQTLLRIMEQKGFIIHEAKGRVFIFTPVISREVVNRQSVQALLDRNFGGSAAELFVNLLEASPVKERDLDELESFIKAYRQRQGLA
jgi:BlaI family penicillinase repressor